MNDSGGSSIAFFVTHHGFGHAARACSVIEALRVRRPDAGIHIFSTVPEWFFAASVGSDFHYHLQETDVGMLQTSPFHADLRQTIETLNRFLPFDLTMVHGLAKTVVQSGCGLVVCDISPLGIAVAEAAGIPSLLVENFTWDWIYAGYSDRSSEFKPHIDYLEDLFSRVTYHVQTDPVCNARPSDLRVAPVGREFRSPRSATRQRLGLPDSVPVVLLTFGGVRNGSVALSEMAHAEDVFFIVLGPFGRIHQSGNILEIPGDATFFHPDLIQASDAVVGKAGYSTIAEIYYAGVPFGYVPRPLFRESPVLERFIERHMTGLAIQEKRLPDGRWVQSLPQLLNLSAHKPSHPNGSHQIADFMVRSVLPGLTP